MTAVEECGGCGLPMLEESGTVWILGALGMAAVHTHREQSCARLAVARHPEQPARRIPEPMSAAEREARKLADV